MKIRTFVFLFFLWAFFPQCLQALNYTLTFTATGVSSVVDSVHVQNISKGIAITVPEGTTLELSDAASTPVFYQHKSLYIYPNPISGTSVGEFYASRGGQTYIKVLSADGKTIISNTEKLATGYHQFKLSLPVGIFFVRINENGRLHTARIIGSGTGKPMLEFTGVMKISEKESMRKDTGAVIPFYFEVGDLLLFKAYSGKYISILEQRVSSNTVILFKFIECRDADGNFYPIVTLGTQIWMAENLKTTCFRNGKEIEYVPDDMKWDSMQSAAWCNYENSASNGETYGHLYNRYAVNDTSIIAPVGWHVPTDTEWTQFENYLISSGFNYDGTTVNNKIAKSIASPLYWKPFSGNGTIGNNPDQNNASGFNALPSGERSEIGEFNMLEEGAYWWTATNANEGNTWIRFTSKSSVNVDRGFTGFKNGLSIRCIKDNNNIPFVDIPAGLFLMGSSLAEVNRNADEIQHWVTLDAFRMSKFEITNKQYAEFLNEKGIGSDGIYAAGLYPTQPLIYASPADYDWGLHYINNKWEPVEGHDDYPVIYVTWYGATEFATYAGGRLPTEAEWEYACRAGTTTPFNTGDCLRSSEANYYWQVPYSGCPIATDTYPGITQPVGTYPPNGWGLYDIHGNVYEWCLDYYDTFTSAAQTNPKGPAAGTKRVLRGGSLWNSAGSCRSACRNAYSPNKYYNDFGFRIVVPF